MSKFLEHRFPSLRPKSSSNRLKSRASSDLKSKASSDLKSTPSTDIKSTPSIDQSNQLKPNTAQRPSTAHGHKSKPSTDQKSLQSDLSVSTSSKHRSRPRSLSSSSPRDSQWPPRGSALSTPWTTPPNSWPGVDIPPRDQVLRSSALLGKILGMIDFGTDRRALKAQRQALLWVALTSKTVSLAAVKCLWRRLDNLMPLLHLLPSFTMKSNKYGLFGATSPHEWLSFDMHATYVKEVIYEDIPKNIQIDPSVYLRLFLRNSSILPNLERFVCKATVRPSESEILVYLQSPLHVLELGVFEPGTLYGGDTAKMSATRDAVISSLTTNPSHITGLVLVDQPFSVLAEGIPLQHLTSLEFRAMYGVMDATLLRQIGSLPYLTSFTADSGCFTGLNLSNIATRQSGARVAGAKQEQAGHGLFTHLTHLELERHPSLPHSTISLFLQLISSPRLRTLILSVRPARKVARAGAKDGTAPADLQIDPLYTIAQRWSRSLRKLQIELDHNHTTVYNFLRHLPALQCLTLTGFLHVPADADITTIVAPSLPHLEVLEFKCRTGTDPPEPLLLDINAITRLVRGCPKLREVDLAISVPTVPPPSATWPISQALRKICIHASGGVGNTVALARYLDKLFPRLNSVRYACDYVGLPGGGEGKDDVESEWKQVQELVFAFQDVRRGE